MGRQHLLTRAGAGRAVAARNRGGMSPWAVTVSARTRGIPLAILEVPRSVSATELAGGFWISGKRSSAAAIEEGFVRRICDLLAETEQLLLIAAAEPVGDAALFLRAGGSWASRSTLWPRRRQRA